MNVPLFECPECGGDATLSDLRIINGTRFYARQTCSGGAVTFIEIDTDSPSFCTGPVFAEGAE